MKLQIIGKLGVASLVLSAAALSTQAMAVTGAQAQGTASVNVITPVQIIANPLGLNFGEFVGGASGGTVFFNGLDIASTGSTQILNSDNATPAAVQIAGEPGYTFQVSLPQNATLYSSNSQMAVDDFNMIIFDNGGNSTNSTVGTGTGSWEIAFITARLNVNANQAPGIYSGSFPVSVAYN